MKTTNYRNRRWLGVTLAAAALLMLAPTAEAGIDGISGTTFNFVADVGQVSTPDGGSIYCWGYADFDGSNNGLMQYPGPTLIVNQGDTITVNLTNNLNVPTSIIFPGHVASAIGGAAGAITQEAAASGGTVSYEFTATHPGTFIYHSGTDPKLQVEMGLLGAIIVRPTGFDPTAPTAYGTTASAYDYEYLFLHTEMDPRVHQHYEFNHAGPEWDNTDWWSVYWFLNGRAAPDDLQEAFVPWLPHQPYNTLPLIEPGQKLLMRVVGLGREIHPFHHHGDHARIIARDGRPLEVTEGGLELSEQVFTIMIKPGETVDAIFDWTGEKMGWDIYGPVNTTCTDANNDMRDDSNPDLRCHDDICFDDNGDGFDDVNWEYCPDHNVPIPVTLPETQNLAFGAWWSGSPYLGSEEALPPGEGGLNPWSGFPFMWHSHTEKELTNYDIFPGGMLTMMFVVPPGTLPAPGTP